MLVTLYKIGGVHFRLLGTSGFHVKAKNERCTAATSRCRQNLKYENFTSSFARLRQNIAPKIVPQVQHDYFPSFNQSNNWFVALWLTLLSSNLKLPKDEKCTCKACKNTVFHFQICKFVGFLLPSSSCLLKLPIVETRSYIFRWRSPFRRRRVCLSFLLWYVTGWQKQLALKKQCKSYAFIVLNDSQMLVFWDLQTRLARPFFKQYFVFHSWWSHSVRLLSYPRQRTPGNQETPVSVPKALQHGTATASK